MPCRSLGFSEFRDFFLLLPQQDMLVEYWVAAGAAPELSDKLSVAGRTGDEGEQRAPLALSVFSSWGSVKRGRGVWYGRAVARDGRRTAGIQDQVHGGHQDL